MARLSRSDLEDILDFAGEVAVAAREPERGDRHLLAHIGRLVPGDVIAYTHFSAGHQMLEDTEVPAGEEPSAELQEALRAENPYGIHARRIRKPHFTATRLYDVISRQALRRTRLYALDPDLGHPSVQMRMPGEAGSKWVLEVVRAGRDFTDREVALLDALRPWLEMYEDRRALGRRIAAAGSAGVDERSAARLSDRENEILDRVAGGASNQEIADGLSISPATVRKHLENIYAKLEVTSRTGALARTGRTAVPARQQVGEPRQPASAHPPVPWREVATA